MSKIKTLEYYKIVPKDYMANLSFRKNVIQDCLNSKKRADEIWKMCHRDLLFFINTFAMTFDPRPNGPSNDRPFITYDFQDEFLLTLDEVYGKEDFHVEKSRDMGATWMFLSYFDWRFLFSTDRESILLVSRKESLVYAPEDPKSLFWKIDFIHKNLPPFLARESQINYTKLHMKNIDNGCTIDGESTTGDVARGDRRTAILLDEFASVPEHRKVMSSIADSSDNNNFLSTPKGIGNSFHDLRLNPKIRKASLLWIKHPLKAKGLYTSQDGALQIQDENYVFPKGYKFITDGKMRSPWYDAECDERISAADIAQELDISYLGSGYQFFDSTILLDHKAKYTIAPFKTGNVIYDLEKGTFKRFEEKENGMVSLWINPMYDGSIPEEKRFMAAADIAAGTGASNSVLTIGDKETGEQVLEFVTPKMLPSEFATACYAILTWFNSPYFIWEANGPGQEFGIYLLDRLGYKNVYFRRDDEDIKKKVSDKPGFWSTPESKVAFLGEYRRALGAADIITRSSMCLKEAEFYVYTNGTVAHSSSLTIEDPSGAKSNHGDRVIANSLLRKVLCAKIKQKTVRQETPVGSFAYRRNRYEAMKEKAAVNENQW